MNSTLLKDSDLDINAYLNSLSLHQSFEEDDSEDDDYLTVNPSGSVLQPACNPYNKQKKIAEANETLFAEEVAPRSPQKVQFNKVEKRICYDYFGSSFESDSIKSYEDEESEKEINQKCANEKNESNFDIKGTHLQPQVQNPASKVIVTVSPRKEEEHHSESESEDVCVGVVENSNKADLKASNIEHEKNIETTEQPSKQLDKPSKQAEKPSKQVEKIASPKKKKDEKPTVSSINKENEIEHKETDKSKEVQVVKKDTQDHSILGKNKVDDTKHPVKNKVEEIKPSQVVKTNTGKNKNTTPVKEKNDKVAFIDLGSNDRKRSSSPSKEIDFYPCLANHSGITIRITGADSIESVDSDNTDNEAQILETYTYHNGNNKINQDSSFPAPKEKQNSIKINETTLLLSNQTFILKGTKSNQNVRSQKPKRYETGPKRITESKTGDKANKPKPNETEKTEQPTSPKIGKHSSATKTNSSKRNKAKSQEEDMKETPDDCQSCNKKMRPKSGVERGSVKVKTVSRPKTAPAKRSCCQWGHPHLPEYNGLRSEYGLSAEQLLERKRHKMEALKAQKQKKEQKSLEEIKKRKENEATFIAWLESKRKQAQEQYLRNQKLQAESGIKIYPAPTAHLKRTKAVRNRKMFKSDRKCISLEELLDKASSHEKKTYRIYLGLSFDD